MSARAFTLGREIVFGAGQYSPHSGSGLQLLTHELVHVAQQGGADVSEPFTISAPDSPLEREAEHSASLASTQGHFQAGPATQLMRATPAATASAPSAPPSGPASAPSCAVAPATAVDGEKLLFNLDSVDLVPGQDKWLDTLVTEAMLSKDVELHGYASTEGPTAYNMDLSCRRAAAVRDLLVARRVTASMKVVAHGETTDYGPAWSNRAVLLTMTPSPHVATPAESIVLARLDRLATIAATEGTKEGVTGAAFSKAVADFRATLKSRMDAVPVLEPLPPDVDIVMKALIIWSTDPGNQWGEGKWDSKDLVMSAHAYATVPASQYKCNAYVAEVIFQSLGLVFKHIPADTPGKFFPFQAREWHDSSVVIPHFPVTTSPVIGDVYATDTHSGIFVGEYAGKQLYVSARDDAGGVFAEGTIQREKGVQIKVIPKPGVFRHFTP